MIPFFPDRQSTLDPARFFPLLATVMTRTALLILGMHRSGTSAFTRLASLCGAALPLDLLAPDAAINQTGFWESPAVTALNEEILGALGRSWSDIRALPPGWAARAARFAPRIAAVLAQQFGDAPVFVLKDPRLCRLLPLWLPVMAHQGIRPVAVLAIRHPLEVAASLNRREHMRPGTALLLWLRHLIEAEAATRHMPRLIVHYDRLLEDGTATLLQIGTALDLTWPYAPGDAAAGIAAFLDRSLRHHTQTDDSLLSNEDIAPGIRAAYRWARGGGDNPLPAIGAVLDAAEPYFAPAFTALEDESTYRAAELRRWIAVAVERHGLITHMAGELESARAQVEALTLHARLIESSTSWRLTAPVRAALRRLKR
jgi:hypothetical protein